MAKQIETILLNELQMGTFIALEKAVNKNYIHADVIANYKMNVINALVRHGVIRQFQTRHYKIVANVRVALKPEVKHRQPKDTVAIAA